MRQKFNTNRLLDGIRNWKKGAFGKTNVLSEDPVNIVNTYSERYMRDKIRYLIKSCKYKNVLKNKKINESVVSELEGLLTHYSPSLNGKELFSYLKEGNDKITFKELDKLILYVKLFNVIQRNVEKIESYMENEGYKKYKNYSSLVSLTKNLLKMVSDNKVVLEKLKLSIKALYDYSKKNELKTPLSKVSLYILGSAFTPVAVSALLLPQVPLNYGAAVGLTAGFSTYLYFFRKVMFTHTRGYSSNVLDDLQRGYIREKIKLLEELERKLNINTNI